MQVDAAMQRPIERRLPQQFTIGHDHREVALQTWILIESLQCLRLPHRYPQRQRSGFHRRWSQLMAASGRAIWLRDDAGDGGAGREQLEGRHGDVRRAHEDGAHGRTIYDPLRRR